jgi:hypothetical protein
MGKRKRILHKGGKWYGSVGIFTVCLDLWETSLWQSRIRDTDALLDPFFITFFLNKLKIKKEFRDVQWLENTSECLTPVVPRHSQWSPYFLLL